MIKQTLLSIAATGAMAAASPKLAGTIIGAIRGKDEEYTPAFTSENKGATCLAKLEGRTTSSLTCGAGFESDGVMCNEEPEAGFACAGALCHKACPSDYHDFGLAISPLCTARSFKFPKLARVKCRWWRGCKYRSCGSGYSRRGGTCYPTRRCPSGMSGDGNTCSKIRKTRRVEAMGCHEGKDLHGLQCLD